jgi:hypothetical protein
VVAQRSIVWSQGSFLPHQAVGVLSLPAEIDGSKVYWMVISHDCDLANCIKELLVEVIPCKPIEKPLGSASYGKNPRLLHLHCSNNAQDIVLELDATLKNAVPKAQVNNFEPDSSLGMNGDNRNILRRWLAARYYRAAFPENFVKLLVSERFGKKDSVASRIETLLDVYGSKIRAILFNLDAGELIERLDGDNYQLGINVLYDSTKDLLAAMQDAESIQQQLEDLFVNVFNQNEKWNGIELIYCDKTSDQVMTVAMQVNLQQWRMEHLSLREDGGGSTLEQS